MAVPFRRTSKTAKRKRRTHYKLTAPHLVVCPQTGEFTLSHRVTPNSGYYNGQLVLERKEPKKAEEVAKKDSKKKK
ncbi:MAG: 50S ribosomal protein L32 [Acholeplasmatales bacterium]|jgi:large subunit ribosomal protein L32|nr:50S ribosomal protein L32 [Acholeplasmatales bacterium]